MSKNIVFEGWLTKSPPSKRIWRTKWRRRWFALRQSGELPGQYFLDYYADRNCRRLKGTINLDLCEQVDAGLHMERTGNGVLDPKLRGSVFTIQTQSRTYHLEADCEAEMEKWVDAICRVCGLRATDGSCEEMDPRTSKMHPISSASTEQTADTTGPYIPISECITGVRAQDSQRAFTFDPKNIVTSTRTPLERVADHREHHIYTSQPQMRLHNTEFSENESNLSDEECKSLTSSQSNIRDFSVAKSFTKLSIKPNNNEVSEDGPPVPPRPPKTFALSKTGFQPYPIVNKAPETSHPQDAIYMYHARRMSEVIVPPPSPFRAVIVTNALVNAEEDEDHHNNQPMQYWNLPIPPAVDRALKPRVSSYSISSASTPSSGTTVLHFVPHEEIRPAKLQYLDLDLKPQGPSSEIIRKSQDIRRRVEISHGKSFSSADADSAYKTVDFLKTEAFNITRQDAEASRSNY